MTARMKAIVRTQYGSPDVLRLAEIDRPTVSDHNVLVRVRSAAVNSGDWRLMRGRPFLIRLMFGGIWKPKIQVLGFDMAGEVEAIGRHVTQVQPGDAVFGDLSGFGFGAFAEYVSVPETALVKKPEQLSFEAVAASSGAGLTALQGLRDRGQLQPGQRVLINGASSGVGSFAVQIAKLMGAEVTAVCHSRKLDRVRLLGADRVIDYTQTDLTQLAKSELHRYDVMFDAAAFQSIAKVLPLVKPGGTYVLVGGAIAKFLQVLVFGPILFRNCPQNVTALEVKPNQADLMILRDWLASGEMVPAIDRRYPLHEVPNAIRDLEARRICGKAVIQVAQS